MLEKFSYSRTIRTAADEILCLLGPHFRNTFDLKNKEK